MKLPTWLRRLLLLCDHKWVYFDTIDDQDLRSGTKFWSTRYVCRKCSKVETREHRDITRT